MSTLLTIGLANALCAAVLAVPAWLAGRRGKPALAHALWLLVLIKLVTPPLFSLPLPWLPPDQPASSRAAAPASAAPLVDTAPLPAEPDVVLDAMSAVEPLSLAPLPAAPLPAPGPTVDRELLPVLPASEPEATPAVAAAPAAPLDLLPLLLVLWLAGVGYCLGRAVVLVRRFQRLLLHARLAPEAIQRQARQLAADMGLKRCPAVWLVPGALPPMVWAIGRARILFPAGLLDRLGEEERASLLVHELAHILRRDHWVRWLEVVSLALYWWCPLAWWARRQLQAREEECCDAWAAQQVSPRTYASAILDAVDFLAEARPRLPAVASPLSGARALRQRLTLVMTARAPRRLSRLARLVLLVLAVAVLPLLPRLTPSSHSAAPPAVAGPAGPASPEPAGDLPEPIDFFANPVNLLGQDDYTSSVAISPDGSRLAAGSGAGNRPGRVDVWDLRTRRLLWTEHERRGVSSVAFTPDGKRLGWGGWGGLVRLEQLGPRRTLYRIPLIEHNHRLAFSRDGKWLALAGENRTLRLVDAATGRLVTQFGDEPTSYYGVCFSHDSKLLAASGGRFQPQGNGGPNQVNLFDVATHKLVGKLTGHSLAVLNVAFAPKDDLIATSSADSTIRIWDGKTFRLRYEMRGHSAGVKGLAFSPDGKLLASGSWDSTVRLWAPDSGKQLAEMKGHPAAVREVAFSPDGKFLVSAGRRRSVKLWDVEKRTLLATLAEEPEPGKLTPPQSLAISPDGKVAALGVETAPDRYAIQLRDTRSGVVLRTLTGHEDAVTALAFSRDGKRLASGGPDLTVRLWEPATGKQVQALKGHTSWVYALAFAPDGKTLASGAYDRTVRLWDVVNGKPLGTLTGHRAAVRALAFSPDGKLLASGSTDQRIRLWEVATRKSKASLKGHDGSVRAVVFAPDGRLASAGEDGRLCLWDVSKGELIGKPRTGLGELLCGDFSPRGQMLVVGAQGGQLHLLDGATAATRRTLNAHSEGVQKVFVGPGGRQIFSLGGDGLVKVWLSRPGGPLRHFEGHTGPVRIVTFSPDGKYLLSCGGWPEGDKTLRLWDVRSGKQVRLLHRGEQQLQSAVFSPDGKHVACGENTGVIHVFETAGGKEVRKLRGHKDGVPGLIYSSDGKWLLSASMDRTLRLWDAETGEAVRIFKGHTDSARCAVFHPDGKHILSGGRDRVIRVWERQTGKLLRSIEHNKEWVERLAVLPDGKRVLTAGGKALRLIDIESGKALRTYPGHQFGSTWVALSRDGRLALSTGYDGGTRLWDVESGLELQMVRGHRDWVWSVEFSPDEKTFATAGGGGQRNKQWVRGDDFTIRLWRMPSSAIARAP